jgi:hypothetical protein
VILRAVDPSGTYGWGGLVKDYCLGENDTFGTCGFAGIGNGHAVVTTIAGHPEVMSDGEIELMDNRVTGFMPTDRTSDHGAALVTILDYWAKYGWAGDPTLVPVDRQEIQRDQIADAIDAMGWAYCWFQLPSIDGQFDLSDASVQLRIQGRAAHCMTVTDAAQGLFHVATWGVRRIVTDAWMDVYWRGGYAVLHPLWRRPELVA